MFGALAGRCVWLAGVVILPPPTKVFCPPRSQWGLVPASATSYGPSECHVVSNYPIKRCQDLSETGVLARNFKISKHSRQHHNFRVCLGSGLGLLRSELGLRYGLGLVRVRALEYLKKCWRCTGLKLVQTRDERRPFGGGKIAYSGGAK